VRAQPLIDQSVRQESHVVLECQLQPVDRRPDSVRWFCNGNELIPSPDYLITPWSVDSGGLCRLTIADVFPEDSASYSCVAVYAGGQTVTTTMTLTVIGQSSHVLLLNY